MDLICPSCGEPYEQYHMRHDEAHEWNISDAERKKFLQTGRFSGPDDPVLKAARACGWEFATNSVLSFIRCPSCKGQPILAGARERRQAVSVIAELLDSDDDALAVERADLAR